MTGIEARIAEVLSDHGGPYTGSDDAVPTTCTCGWDGSGDAHAHHVAAVLVAELELTPEYSNDVAGPTWARYRRYVTPTETVYHRLRDGLTQERAE